MPEKIVVRLFVDAKCSGKGCGCGPDPNIESFGDIAEKLAKNLGEKHFEFEVCKGIDLKKFPFLSQIAKSKSVFPIVTLDEKILCHGKIPSSNELEKEAVKIMGEALK